VVGGGYRVRNPLAEFVILYFSYVRVLLYGSRVRYLSRYLYDSIGCRLFSMISLLYGAVSFELGYLELHVTSTNSIEQVFGVCMLCNVIWSTVEFSLV
jgi:hypothetical protein